MISLKHKQASYQHQQVSTIGEWRQKNETHWTEGLDGSNLVQQYESVLQHIGIGGMTGMPSCTPVPASPLLCPREAVLPALSGRAGPQEETEPASHSAGLPPAAGVLSSDSAIKWTLYGGGKMDRIGALLKRIRASCRINCGGGPLCSLPD